MEHFLALILTLIRIDEALICAGTNRTRHQSEDAPRNDTGSNPLSSILFLQKR